MQAVESDECVGSKRRVSLVKSSRIRVSDKNDCIMKLLSVTFLLYID